MRKRTHPPRVDHLARLYAPHTFGSRCQASMSSRPSSRSRSRAPKESPSNEQGSRGGCPVQGRSLERLPHVEEGAAGIYACHGRRDRVIRLEALRRCDALEDSRRGAWAVTSHGEDARAPIRERDLKDSRSVGLRALVDVVDEADLGLEVGELPADERREDRKSV